MNASEPTTAYLFVHFTGLEQSETDEQLYFALSRDGRHWRDLREAGFPVLTWKGGEGGVRDPHIVRDPRGGFHIVATDLSIYHRGGWGPHDGATENGSTASVSLNELRHVHSPSKIRFVCGSASTTSISACARRRTSESSGSTASPKVRTPPPR